MHDTFQIHIRPDHRQDMCLIVMELLFRGDHLSKQSQQEIWFSASKVFYDQPKVAIDSNFLQ